MTTGIPVDDHIRRWILKLNRAHVPASEISRMVGVCRATVWRVVKDGPL